jgi:hypothetical protein
MTDRPTAMLTESISLMIEASVPLPQYRSCYRGPRRKEDEAAISGRLADD